MNNKYKKNNINLARRHIIIGILGSIVLTRKTPLSVGASSVAPVFKTLWQLSAIVLKLLRLLVIKR